MEWFIAVLAVLVLGVAAVAAAGGLGQFGPITVDRPPLQLPDDDLTADDLARVRFLVVPRGYAMDQVDEVLNRLQTQLSGQSGTAYDSESEIMDAVQFGDRRNHDGSDETSYGRRTD